jgi:tetratricopeptide (TPR) repeat protein
VNRLSQDLRLWTTGLVLAGLVCLLYVPIGHWQSAMPKLQQLTHLPDGQYLRMASLGYRELAADVLWLQAVQVMGEPQLSPERGGWLYQLVDRVTTLDPRFVAAYEAGSLALCTLVVMPEESNRLLEKGIRAHPQAWRLPFLLAINYYFELGDDEKAAQHMARAAQLPGSPPNLPFVAARLFVSARSPQQAIEMLAKLYEETSDENTKKFLELRLKQLVVEQDIQVLEQAIDRYHTARSGLPAQLEDLVRYGVLRELPREPFGGQYLYEPTTGAVRSSEMSERLRMPDRRRIH